MIQHGACAYLVHPFFPPVYPELPSQEWSSLTGLSARESATTSLDRPESTAHG